LIHLIQLLDDSLQLLLGERGEQLGLGEKSGGQIPLKLLHSQMSPLRVSVVM
jgi:hypothetical protein